MKEVRHGGIEVRRAIQEFGRMMWGKGQEIKWQEYKARGKEEANSEELKSGEKR